MKATILAAALLLVAGLARVDTQSTNTKSPPVGRALSGAPGGPDKVRPTEMPKHPPPVVHAPWSQLGCPKR